MHPVPSSVSVEHRVPDPIMRHSFATVPQYFPNSPPKDDEQTPILNAHSFRPNHFETLKDHECFSAGAREPAGQAVTPGTDSDHFGSSARTWGSDHSGTFTSASSWSDADERAIAAGVKPAASVFKVPISPPNVLQEKRRRLRPVPVHAQTQSGQQLATARTASSLAKRALLGLKWRSGPRNKSGELHTLQTGAVPAHGTQSGIYGRTAPQAALQVPQLVPQVVPQAIQQAAPQAVTQAIPQNISSTAQSMLRPPLAQPVASGIPQAVPLADTQQRRACVDAAFSTYASVNSELQLPTLQPQHLPPSTSALIPKPQNIALRKVIDLTPPSQPCDDESGYYVFKEGELFADRYVITRQLGQGTFGKVVEAYDKHTKKRYAIKVIRAIPKYRDAARIELRVLSMIAQCDLAGQSKCVTMHECFDYRNHVCLVTELLDVSLYDFLLENNFAPFPMHQLVDLARQILLSVAFIHDLGMVHTDLKPENILLCDSHSVVRSFCTNRGRIAERRELLRTDVKTVDFGSAVFNDEYHSPVVSTRHYRAPEIILGTGWSYPCDIWSVGCLLIELSTGAVLFQTRDNLEHLHMMEKTLGTRFSKNMIRLASRTSAGSSLVDASNARLIPVVKGEFPGLDNQHTIKRFIECLITRTQEKEFWTGFLDLIYGMMALDPAKRLTAKAALAHPWFILN